MTHFARPTHPRSFEAEIQHQAALMRERRADFARKREARHAGHWDDQSIEVIEPKPPLPDTPPQCDTEDCENLARARKGGDCGACYRRKRRALGHP